MNTVRRLGHRQRRFAISCLDAFFSIVASCLLLPRSIGSEFASCAAQPAAIKAYAAAPAAAPAGMSPSGADVRVLPIDLPTALRLADTSNPTIAFARERVREAYAHLREAEVLWLPSLHTGPAYLRHDGIIQNAREA